LALTLTAMVLPAKACSPICFIIPSTASFGTP
jgi:hypothetical protein